MKMCSAKQIFDSFPGIWKLTRETVPLKQLHNSGTEYIRANGFAAFTSTESNPNILIYSEKVSVNCATNSKLNGLEARQKYKYRYDNTDQTLTKYFFDDRLFYTMKIQQRNENETAAATASNNVTACGTHLCIQDLYEANYLFSNDKQFQLKYTINGPQKCYEIITMYSKCTDDEVAQFCLQIANGEIL